MLGMKENDFILPVLCRNGVSDVSDGKPLGFPCR